VMAGSKAGVRAVYLAAYLVDEKVLKKVAS
jgi:hypothetical protein